LRPGLQGLRQRMTYSQRQRPPTLQRPQGPGQAEGEAGPRLGHPGAAYPAAAPCLCFGQQHLGHAVLGGQFTHRFHQVGVGGAGLRYRAHRDGANRCRQASLQAWGVPGQLHTRAIGGAGCRRVQAHRLGESIVPRQARAPQRQANFIFSAGV